MTSTFLTVGNAQKSGNMVIYDYYESADKPVSPNTPPKNILKHRDCHMIFRTPRDAQSFYDILVLAIDHWEIKDK